MKKIRAINPASLKKPSGYTHGFLTEGGRTLHLAGQTAASLGPDFSDDFVDQFDRSLAAVIEVVKDAGGKPEDLVTFTIYVKSAEEYNASLKPLGEVYRKWMGRHFPGMALLEVTRMVNPKVKIEIVAVAVLD